MPPVALWFFFVRRTQLSTEDGDDTNVVVSSIDHIEVALDYACDAARTFAGVVAIMSIPRVLSDYRGLLLPLLCDPPPLTVALAAEKRLLCLQLRRCSFLRAGRYSGWSFCSSCLPPMPSPQHSLRHRPLTYWLPAPRRLR